MRAQNGEGGNTDEEGTPPVPEEQASNEDEDNTNEPESSSAPEKRKRKKRNAVSNSESESEPDSVIRSKNKKPETERSAAPLTKRQQRRVAKRQRLRENGNAGDFSSSSSDSDSSDSDALTKDGKKNRRRRRRRRAARYTNAENDELLFRKANKNQGRLPGQTDFCAMCHSKFTVTVYSQNAPQALIDEIKKEREAKKEAKELKKLEKLQEQEFVRRAMERTEDLDENQEILAPADKDEEGSDSDSDSDDDHRLEDTLLLCPVCSRDTLSKGKVAIDRAQEAKADASKTTKMYRRKVAAALLDRREYSNVPSLQDLCIKMVTENIENVEALGSLSFHNRDRIARILSRNRMLNSSSVKLFLEPNVKNLELWDCSQISSDSLNLIPAYCPFIEKLTLSMCGQVRSEFLNKCAAQLVNLKEVYLDGAFLVSATAWSDFFMAIGDRLEKLMIRNTHRFTSESLAVLVESCPNLTHLTLSRVSGLTDPAGYLLIPRLANLVHLDISHPPQDVVMANDIELISDETIITILNTIGTQLQTLILDGCSELTDRFITDGLRPCCSPLRLKKLSLANLDQLSDEAVSDLFNTWSDSLSKLRADPIMTSLNLERCIGLTDDSISAMFDFVHSSIITLNLSALPDVSAKPFETAFNEKYSNDNQSVAYFPFLESLRVNFVQSISNELLKTLAEYAPHLEFIEVFGVSNVNRDCFLRPGVKLIGRLDALDL